jgi:hypothetical protein
MVLPPRMIQDLIQVSPILMTGIRHTRRQWDSLPGNLGSGAHRSLESPMTPRIRTDPQRGDSLAQMAFNGITPLPQTLGSCRRIV